MKRSVFRNLLIAMVCFGAFIGVIFPPFAYLLLGTDKALTPSFWAMCISAGIIVGLVNFLLFRLVVYREIGKLVRQMDGVNRSVINMEQGAQYDAHSLHLEVTSEDLLGRLQHAFNDMSQAIARRLETDSTTRHFLSRLSAGVEIEHVAGVILETLFEICQGERGAFYCRRPDQIFELQRVFGMDEDSHSCPPELVAPVDSTTEALLRGEILDFRRGDDVGYFEPFRKSLMTQNCTTFSLLPFAVGAELIGLAVFTSCRMEETPQQRFIVQNIAKESGPYIANALLHNKVSRLAAMDELTKLFNRRFGLRRFVEEFALASRHERPLGVVILDIDFFKKVNDTHGHDAGDLILRQVAKTMRDNLRSSDILCRYGGEEFLLVLPQANLEQTLRSAERLRVEVSRLECRYKDVLIPVTISSGVIAYPEYGVEQAEELVTQADHALYYAKECGRNRVGYIQQEGGVDLFSRAESS